MREVHEPIQVVTTALTATIARLTLVLADGSQCGNGEHAYGVALEAGVSGDSIPVGTDGIFTMTAGAAITANADVASDANGKIVPATTGEAILGTALGAAAADGSLVRVKLQFKGAAA